MNEIFRKRYQNYLDNKHKLQTFDIILLKNTAIYSKFISVVESIFFKNGKWTHVGVIFNSNFINIKNSEPNTLYLFESTISNDVYPDVELNDGYFGVQIRNLDDIIKEAIVNKANIGLCNLLNNPIYRKNDETIEEQIERLKGLKNRIQHFYDSKNHKKYDFLNLVRTLNKYIKLDKKQDERYFCAELATEICEICGLIDSGIDPEELAPVELEKLLKIELTKI